MARLRRIVATMIGAMAQAPKSAHSFMSRVGAGFIDQSRQASPAIAASNAARNTSALVRKINPSSIPARMIHAVLRFETDARQKHATIAIDSATPSDSSYE